MRAAGSVGDRVGLTIVGTWLLTVQRSAGGLRGRRTTLRAGDLAWAV